MEYKDDDTTTLDLRCQSMKKIPMHLAREKSGSIIHLHLDNNDIQKLEYLSSFKNVTEFTASGNQLLRMYNIASLRNLITLDLSSNKIISIEGLKEVTHLTSLNLSHNKIKEIDHLHTNINIEHLDLSDNIITNISNMSQLSKLKKLMLHNNQLCALRHSEVYLPKSIEVLTLADNRISDLNEVSRLVGLINLKEISFKSNPCIEMTGQSVGFDYRPFLVNWCPGLKVIDEFAVDELESLRGEWLYSQGKGRQFRPGEHAQLVQYLAENVPFNNEPLQSERERKLRLILSKAHQHQSQLRFDTLSTERSSTSLMSRSLDSSGIYGFTGEKPSSQPVKMLSRSLHCPSNSSKKEKEMKVEEVPAPLPAASKLVPVPESLISPMVANVPDIPGEIETQSCGSSANSVYYNCEEISAFDLQRIKTKADEIRWKKSEYDQDVAAKCIQKNWRGFLTRNTSNFERAVTQIQSKRVQQHIESLAEEMASLKLALEKEHKLHILQMQAINSLWRKMCNWQQTSRQEIGFPHEVQEPSTSCSHHYDQMQQIHACIQQMQRNLTENRYKPAVTHEMFTQTDVDVHTPNVCYKATVTYEMFTQTDFAVHTPNVCYKAAVKYEMFTQTDIVAVHTPNVSYKAAVTHEVYTQTDIVAVHTPDDSYLTSRPSSLPVSSHQVTQYAENLVGDVIKDTMEEHNNSEAEQ